MYLEMFSHHFPSSSAKKTVPSQGKSIACSTAAAIAWDASFENLLDPSGRAVGGVHDQVITKNIADYDSRYKILAPTTKQKQCMNVGSKLYYCCK